jgi:hypothetical protein
MGAEADIYSPEPPITAAELTAAAGRMGIRVRMFDAELIDHDGAMREPAAEEPLRDHVVIVGWPSSAEETTRELEEAIPKGDKFTVDRLGREGKLGWCELTPRAFDYERLWGRLPEERPEYEASVAAEDLGKIKAARTRYALRSSFRGQNAQLLGAMVRVLKEATRGVSDEG